MQGPFCKCNRSATYQPEVGLEGLRGLVVERVEEVDSVLVDLVREVRAETLADHLLELLAGDLN